MRAKDVNSKYYTVTISKETHQRLVALPFCRDATSQAVANNNGTVSFTVPPHIHTALKALHDDTEMAIQILLGLKTN